MSKDVEQSLAEVVSRIFVVRGKRVMMDSDLALLYGIETRVLNQAVRRNRERFPGDFVLDLSYQEVARSRSQSVILNNRRGGNLKHLPLASIRISLADAPCDQAPEGSVAACAALRVLDKKTSISCRLQSFDRLR